MNTYTQLSQDERYTMCMFLAKGFTKAEVAQVMNRSISTIYRELDRNKRPDGRYAASVAHNFYRGRLRRSRRGTTYSDACWNEIFRLLRLKWSPEQIVNHMQQKKVFQSVSKPCTAKLKKIGVMVVLSIWIFG